MGGELRVQGGQEFFLDMGSEAYPNLSTQGQTKCENKKDKSNIVTGKWNLDLETKLKKA